MSAVHHWRLVADLDAFTGDKPGDMNAAQIARLETLVRTFLSALFPLGVSMLALYDMTEIAERGGMPLA